MPTRTAAGDGGFSTRQILGLKQCHKKLTRPCTAVKLQKMRCLLRADAQRRAEDCDAHRETRLYGIMPCTEVCVLDSAQRFSSLPCEPTELYALDSVSPACHPFGRGHCLVCMYRFIAQPKLAAARRRRTVYTLVSVSPATGQNEQLASRALTRNKSRFATDAHTVSLGL